MFFKLPEANQIAQSLHRILVLGHSRKCGKMYKWEITAQYYKFSLHTVITANAQYHKAGKYGSKKNTSKIASYIT